MPAALNDYSNSSFEFNGMIGWWAVGYNQSLRAAGAMGKLWLLTDMV